MKFPRCAFVFLTVITLLGTNDVSAVDINDDAVRALREHWKSNSQTVKNRQLNYDSDHQLLGTLMDGGTIVESLTKKQHRNIRRLDESNQYLTDNACFNSLVAHQTGWMNWFAEIETYAPVFRVKTDNELRNLIGAATSHQCTIRPMGATTSEDGLIMQRTEKNFVIVSLVDHVPDDSNWAPQLDTTTGRVRLLAGMSWYQAAQVFRSSGFVLEERTAGRYFSVGGVIATNAHGGRSNGGFIHSDVTKMLVMLSDGNTEEIVDQDELLFWQSSGGQLGIILAVEMQLRSEANGGLNMRRSIDSFSHLLPIPPTAPSTNNVTNLAQNIAQHVYGILATSDHNMFFYDWYSSTLASYYTDFSGPAFDGSDLAQAALYQASADHLHSLHPDVAFTGGPSYISETLENLDLCDFFCVPNLPPCVPIPSQTQPGENLCNVPLEVAAALNGAALPILDEQWNASANTINDGMFSINAEKFQGVNVFVPSRVFVWAFTTWWGVFAKAVAGYIPGIDFKPNGLCVFRFLSPSTRAVMNPIPTLEEWKNTFDAKNFNGAFDTFFPQLQNVPDGIVAIEFESLRGVYDADAPKFLQALEQAWLNMPLNPLAQNSPIIPAITGHLAKAYGYGIDFETTPITSQPVPFHDQNIISTMYDVVGDESSIGAFSAKIEELNATVFSGGGFLRFLQPSKAEPYEVRKLFGQECASEEFALNPDAECIETCCDATESQCVPCTPPDVSIKGDPHIQTWSGMQYDFHGVCDLVLLQNSDFQEGLGMDIHVRTKQLKQFSYVSSAVLRIGDETLEVMGDIHENLYWINKQAEADLGKGINGYPISYRKVNSKQHEFIVDLGNGISIVMKTFKKFVRVNINGATKESFGASRGLLGIFGSGAMMNRAKNRVLEDTDAFGQEWQVLPSDGMLFHNVEGPQAPAKCKMPLSTSLRRRLVESDVSEEEAQIACAHVNHEDVGMCVFDVMATGEKDVVGAY